MTETVAVGPWNGAGQHLLCPRCGGEYMHQSRVVVKNREDGREDGSGAAVTIAGTGATVVPLPAGLMDGRRQSLWIEFVCEFCVGGLWLCMEQHKGHTHMTWEKHAPRGMVA